MVIKNASPPTIAAAPAISAPTCNAAQYLPQRRRLLHWWADRLDGLKVEEMGQAIMRE